MENATKALLIAAAILIAIVLISLGVFVLNSGSATINDATKKMDQTKIMAFNSTFTPYEGKQRGSQCNALVQSAIATNEQEKVDNGGSGVEIKVNNADPTSIAKFNTGDIYTVSFSYTNGVITGITIVK